MHAHRDMSENQKAVAGNQQGKVTSMGNSTFTKQVSKNKFILDKNLRASPDHI